MIIGVIGSILFLVISQDYESDKKFNFTDEGKSYETRRYSFGFATLDDTRYTFETYRTFKYLPFEILIDKTNFFDTKTKLNIGGEIKIEVKENGNIETITFKSPNGNTFSKTLH
ncbi:MAG: hypothetical protein NTX03_13570 [Bacteroidetes bacterium]|nr:hypothetical protein [Bacteroidota bacterium]